MRAAVSFKRFAAIYIENAWVISRASFFDFTHFANDDIFNRQMQKRRLVRGSVNSNQ